MENDTVVTEIEPFDGAEKLNEDKSDKVDFVNNFSTSVTVWEANPVVPVPFVLSNESLNIMESKFEEGKDVCCLEGCWLGC